MNPRTLRFTRSIVRTTCTSSSVSAARTTERAIETIDNMTTITKFYEESQINYTLGDKPTRISSKQIERITKALTEIENVHSGNLTIILDEYENNTLFEHEKTRLANKSEYYVFATYSMTADWGGLSETIHFPMPFDIGFNLLLSGIRKDIEWAKSERATNVEHLGDMVLSPNACGLLVHEFIGHMLEKDNYIHSPFVLNNSFELPSTLSVFENYECDEQYDDMGFEIPKDLELIRKGRIVDLISEGNFRKGAIHRHPIPRMRSMFISPGDHSEDKLVHSINDGVYVCKIDSGEMNHLSGDFSVIVSQSNKITEGKVGIPLSKFAIFFSVESFSRAGLSFSNKTSHIKTLCGKEGSFVPIEIRSPACCIRNVGEVAHYG